MKRTDIKVESIDEYIAIYPPEVQDILRRLRALVREIAPETTESISYGIPTFKLYGNNLVDFGAYPHHIGFYPTPSGIEAFKDRLSEYKQSKGTVQFPLERPIPYELVRDIVLFRVKENYLLAKKKGRG